MSHGGRTLEHSIFQNQFQTESFLSDETKNEEGDCYLKIILYQESKILRGSGFDDYLELNTWVLSHSHDN